MLRTGAHAAWAVPAVQVATMVPAMAASGPQANLIATIATISVESSSLVTTGRRLRADFLFKNTGSGPTGAITLDLSNLRYLNASRDARWTTSSTGWQVTANQGTATNGTTGCTLTRAASLAPNATSSLSVIIEPETYLTIRLGSVANIALQRWNPAQGLVNRADVTWATAIASPGTSSSGVL